MMGTVRMLNVRFCSPVFASPTFIRPWSFQCEKVWPEDDSDSSDYDSSSSSDDENPQDWEWVNNGRGWTKEPIDKETQNKESLASDDDDDSYYISSDSDSEEGPAAKWVRANGQWKQIG